MIIICSWCGKEMGEKSPLEDKAITHTICVDCELKEEKKMADFDPPN